MPKQTNLRTVGGKPYVAVDDNGVDKLVVVDGQYVALDEGLFKGETGSGFLGFYHDLTTLPAGLNTGDNALVHVRKDATGDVYSSYVWDGAAWAQPNPVSELFVPTGTGIHSIVESGDILTFRMTDGSTHDVSAITYDDTQVKTDIASNKVLADANKVLIDSNKVDADSKIAANTASISANKIATDSVVSTNTSDILTVSDELEKATTNASSVVSTITDTTVPGTGTTVPHRATRHFHYGELTNAPDIANLIADAQPEDAITFTYNGKLNNGVVESNDGTTVKTSSFQHEEINGEHTIQPERGSFSVGHQSNLNSGTLIQADKMERTTFGNPADADLNDVPNFLDTMNIFNFLNDLEPPVEGSSIWETGSATFTNNTQEMVITIDNTAGRFVVGQNYRLLIDNFLGGNSIFNGVQIFSDAATGSPKATKFDDLTAYGYPFGSDIKIVLTHVEGGDFLGETPTALKFNIMLKSEGQFQGSYEPIVPNKIAHIDITDLSVGQSVEHDLPNNWNFYNDNLIFTNAVTTNSAKIETKGWNFSQPVYWVGESFNGATNITTFEYKLEFVNATRLKLTLDSVVSHNISTGADTNQTTWRSWAMTIEKAGN